MQPEGVALLVYGLCFVAMVLMVCMLFLKFCRMTYDFEEFNRQIEVHNLNQHGEFGTGRLKIGQEVNEETQV